MVQARERLCTPPSHVTLQLLHTPQFDQTPLTKNKCNRGLQCHLKCTSYNFQETSNNPCVYLFVYCFDQTVSGHSLLLQAWVKELFPWQSTPALSWGGLVQVRVRVCTPLPQLRLQPPQGPQFDQPPFTMEGKGKKLTSLVRALDFEYTCL